MDKLLRAHCDRIVKEAVAAVLADENNTYSKNELKAAALRLKKLFGDGDG